MTVTILPVYKGYTVDARLRQFRKAEFGQTLEFIAFDSPQGRELLDGMAKDAPDLFERVYGRGN